jgi:ferritin-like metal-binding protein YciE
MGICIRMQISFSPGVFIMHLDTLRDLINDQLRDLYSAETQLVKALPKMAKHVTSPNLKKTIETHLEETKRHVERLQQVGQLMQCNKLTGKKCKAMEGLIEEGEEALDANGCEMVIDAAIIAAAQRVEHYEMAAYGSARTMIELLGNNEAVSLLQQTLDEEKNADMKLTQVAEQEIYPQITQDGEEKMDGTEEGNEEPVAQGAGQRNNRVNRR